MINKDLADEWMNREDIPIIAFISKVSPSPIA